jgi:sugar lactone lactonase YvrE
MSSGAYSPTIILSGLIHPSAVAIDPQGNLFYSEYSGAQTISELPKGSSTPVRLATGPFDAFMSVDSNDNLYFVNGDTCDGRTSVISEYVHSTGMVVTVLSDANPGYGGTPSGPYGDVYAAPSGDLYLTACDHGTVQVLKAGTSVPQVLVTGLIWPNGIAVDSQGDVFYTEYSSGVYMIPAGSSIPMTISTKGVAHYGLRLDGQRNVYYTDNVGGTIWKIPIASATPLSDMVTVHVSPASVSSGATITASGTVTAGSGSVSNTGITITVKNPGGTDVSIGTATLTGSAATANYTLPIVVGGTSSWIGGNYTVVATYMTALGGTPATATAFFSYLSNFINTATFVVSAPAAQASVGGHAGVQIAYTSTYSQSLSVFVWVIAKNNIGQATGIFVGSATTISGAGVTVFVPTSNLPSGNYNASIFATTASSIAVSQISTVSLSVP